METKPSFFWTVIKTKRISTRTERVQTCIKHFSMPKKNKSVIVINKGRSPFIKTCIYYFQSLSTYRVKSNIWILFVSLSIRQHARTRTSFQSLVRVQFYINCLPRCSASADAELWGENTSHLKDTTTVVGSSNYK